MTEEISKDIKARNENYIKTLNDYDRYIVDSIANNDVPKLRNCVEYTDKININGYINTKGTTFLHYAASKQDAYSDKKGFSSILSILIEAGADVFAKDEDGLTAKDYAKLKNHSSNVSILGRAEQEALLIAQRREKRKMI